MDKVGIFCTFCGREKLIGNSNGDYYCFNCKRGFNDLVYREPQIEFEEKVDISKLQNQKAIDCLKEVLEHFIDRPTYFDEARYKYDIGDKDKRFIDYINNKIKELEEGK